MILNESGGTEELWKLQNLKRNCSMIRNAFSCLLQEKAAENMLQRQKNILWIFIYLRALS